MRSSIIMEMNTPIKNYLLILVFFVMANLLEIIHSQTTRPLCYVQISAANQACAILSPEVISSSLVATNGSRHKRHNRHKDVRHNSDDDDGGDSGGGDDDNDGGDDGGDSNGGDDDNDGGDDGGGDDDDHHGHRKHKRKKGHHESSANKECCRWLQELDNECVCEALLKLPSFLVKPKHRFMIRVGRSCRHTYNCPGFLPIPPRRRH